MAAYTCNPSTQETGLLQIWGQLGLDSKFQASQGYKEEQSSKKQTNRSFTMEEFLGKGRGKTDLQIKRIQIKSFLK